MECDSTMEYSPSGQRTERKTLPGGFEVTIWCTINSDNEDDARQVAFEYCQRLKTLFEKRLIVKAVEIGFPAF